MKHKVTLSFAVRNESNQRAALWACSVVVSKHNSMLRDVYIAPKYIPGMPKVSYHKDGNCFFAHIRDYCVKAGFVDHNKNKAIAKWHESTLFMPKPGVFLALRILTPNGAINTPIVKNLGSEISWLPAAPTGKMTAISLLFQKPDSKTKFINTEKSLFHKISLPSGETLWFLCHHIEPMPLHIPKTDTKPVFNKLLPDDLKMREQDDYRAIYYSFDENIPSFYDMRATSPFFRVVKFQTK